MTFGTIFAAVICAALGVPLLGASWVASTYREGWGWLLCAAPFLIGVGAGVWELLS